MRGRQDTMRGRLQATRRAALAMGAGVAGSLLLGSPRAFAQSAPYSFKVGEAQVTVISDGGFSLALSYALPDTPMADAASVLGSSPAPERLPAAVNVVVVRHGERLILIDAGGSPDFISTIGSFGDRFEQAGFRAADVTDVIFTHAHPDHLWGAVDPLDEPRFPKARHVLAHAERDFWVKPGLPEIVPDALKGAASGTQRRMKILDPQIVGAPTGKEIAPGISYVPSAGHTPGHACVLLTSGSASLLIGGDTLSNPAVSFAAPEWAWGPDYDAQQAIATRKSLLDRLATDRILLLGYHLPWPGTGYVERKDNAYRFVPHSA